jgi:hypothetical protein
VCRAIRSERKLARTGGPTNKSELDATDASLMDRSAAKVERQAVAMLGPTGNHTKPNSHSLGSSSLSDLVVSVGTIPQGAFVTNITADNLADTFRNIHDPV